LALPAPNLFLDVVHFSNLGHQKMAAMLAPIIEEELIR